jgi:TetR/AcrR family transcriptional regulator, mexJK operon transcriptional repressor
MTALETATRPRARSGRPTKAAAAERDERLLEIATHMFLEQGFEATSIDALAEAASIGKATLYARYADKGALFADVLRRRIIEVYGGLEAEFAAAPGGDLQATLQHVAERFLDQTLQDSSVALGRILAAQGARFPELAQLAMTEGYERQVRLISSVLARFDGDPRYVLGDLATTADFFLALVLGRTSRIKIYGLAIDREEMRHRTRAAVAFFVRGVSAA